MPHRLPLADIQFISDFAVFARSKGDEEYDYVSNCNCAMAQFLRDTHRAENPRCSSEGWSDNDGALNDNPDGIDNPGLIFGGDGRSALRDYPRTFSALADRLEALIADAPMVRS